MKTNPQFKIAPKESRQLGKRKKNTTTIFKKKKKTL